MGNESKFKRLMDEVADGSDQAVWELVQTYTPYIIRSVRMSLSAKLRPRLDSHDVAQALWMSLLLGDVDLSRMKTPEALIAFLARAAKNKVVSQARRHQALKRDVTREIAATADFKLSTPGESNASALYSREPSPSKVIAVREQWDQIISSASDRDRRIIHMRMERRSFEDISSEVNVSQMTARRAIERLVSQLCQ
jgi:RNA polymerase sigma factor (sigma-70 family)